MYKYHLSLKTGFILVLFIFSVTTAFAQFAGGSGTQHDPYLIETATHLNNIRNYSNCWFRQIADIDLNIPPYNQLSGWQPIGDPFANYLCRYNGSNYAISNLYINSQWSWKGLFGETSGAVLDSIRLMNANVTGEAYVGGLIGKALSTTITHCRVSGNVTGGEYTGGLVGQCESGTVISYCSSDADVNCIFVAGGLVGQCLSASILSKCCTWGFVDGELYSGGLVGIAASSTISNCFTYGITGGMMDNGGLIGSAEQATVTNCYARGLVGSFSGGGGGLVGSNSGSIITLCYWDVQTTYQNTSQGGEGRSTDEMTWPYADNTYVNWDFTNTWTADVDIALNFGYPYMQNVWFINTVPCPAIYPIPGTYHNAIQLSLYLVSLSASIYYTLNGDIPTEQSYLYTEPVSIDSTFHLRAKAFKNGWIPSGTVGGYYTFQSLAPLFDPTPNYYTDPFWVTLSTNTVGASIHYTLDGSDPTEQSILFTQPIPGDSTTFIKARAYKPGYEPSIITIGDYTYHEGNSDETVSPPAIICQAYPNPFTQSTCILFSLPKSNKISLSVYNSRGQLVKVLANNNYIEGENTVIWDGTDTSSRKVSSGVYFLEMQGTDFRQSRKLLLLK